MASSSTGTTIHGYPEVSDQDYRKITSKALTRVSYFLKFSFFYNIFILFVNYSYCLST